MVSLTSITLEILCIFSEKEPEKPETANSADQTQETQQEQATSEATESASITEGTKKALSFDAKAPETDTKIPVAKPAAKPVKSIPKPTPTPAQGLKKASAATHTPSKTKKAFGSGVEKSQLSYRALKENEEVMKKEMSELKGQMLRDKREQNQIASTLSTCQEKAQRMEEELASSESAREELQQSLPLLVEEAKAATLLQVTEAQEAVSKLSGEKSAMASRLEKLGVDPISLETFPEPNEEEKAAVGARKQERLVRMQALREQVKQRKKNLQRQQIEAEEMM
jgi:hypothetical protein